MKRNGSKLKNQKLQLFQLLLVLILGCSNNSQTEMIDIKIEDPKPEYFGWTGLHCYSYNFEESNGRKTIVLNDDNRSVRLGKIFNDVSMFLTNELEAYPTHRGMRRNVVFGKDEEVKSIATEALDKYSLSLLGILHPREVKEVSSYLAEQDFEQPSSIENQFNKLTPAIQKELQILLDDDLISSLHAAMKKLTEFYKECSENGEGVMMVYAP